MTGNEKGKSYLEVILTGALCLTIPIAFGFVAKRQEEKKRTDQQYQQVRILVNYFADSNKDGVLSHEETSKLYDVLGFAQKTDGDRPSFDSMKKYLEESGYLPDSLRNLKEE